MSIRRLQGPRLALMSRNGQWRHSYVASAVSLTTIWIGKCPESLIRGKILIGCISVRCHSLHAWRLKLKLCLENECIYSAMGREYLWCGMHKQPFQTGPNASCECKIMEGALIKWKIYLSTRAFWLSPTPLLMQNLNWWLWKYKYMALRYYKCIQYLGKAITFFDAYLNTFLTTGTLSPLLLRD